MDEPSNPFGRVVEFWEAVVADMEATAAEYRDAGWDVVELHPGDVTALDGDGGDGRWGLDVLVPDDEFSAVERRVVEEGGEFDACEVYRAEAGGLVFLVVAMLDGRRREAILVPAYYDPARAEGTLARAREAGEMRVHVRTLQGDTIVTFTQSDPSLFTA